MQERNVIETLSELAQRWLEDAAALAKSPSLEGPFANAVEARQVQAKIDQLNKCAADLDGALNKLINDEESE